MRRKTIVRWLLPLFILLFNLLHGTTPTYAATSKGEGVLGWKTVVGAGKAEYFSSALEACARQYEVYANPKDPFEGYKDTKDWSFKICDWLTHVEGGFFTILPGPTHFDCEFGYERVAPGRCVLKKSGYSPPEDRPLCGGNSGSSPNPTGGTNPILLASGVKYEAETDFTTADNRLRVERIYRSSRSNHAFAEPLPLDTLTTNWRLNFGYDLELFEKFGSTSRIYNRLTAYLPDGSAYNFERTQNGTFAPQGGDSQQVPVKLELLSPWLANPKDFTKSSTRWRLTLENNRVVLFETFPPAHQPKKYIAARPVQITEADGYTQTLSYNKQGALSSLTDSFGRKLTFSWLVWDWGSTKLPPQPIAIQTINLPDGTSIHYRYNSSMPTQEATKVSAPPDRLIAVEFKSGSKIIATRQYHYEDQRFPWALTGLTDERGVRVASWAYDGFGRAVSSQSAGGQNKYTVAYNDTNNKITRTVTNPLGKKSTYSFTRKDTVLLLTKVDGTPSKNCIGTTRNWAYDKKSGFLTQTVDENGRATQYEFNARALPTKIVEAAGKPAARTTTYQWQPTLRLPSQITRGNLQTTYNYSGGQLLSVTQKDLILGKTRALSYSYTPKGLLTKANGLLSGAGDTTSYTYDSAGYLKTITNPLGHQFTIESTNHRGLPTQYTDENGVITSLGYDQRGRLTAFTYGTQKWQLAYDASGHMTKITKPDSSYLAYGYDAVGRLTSITNTLGERMVFAYDAMGNVTRQEIHNTGGKLVQLHRQTFDELGRLLTQIGAAGNTWRYAYDKAGNLDEVTDPLKHAHANDYDGLNRLIASIDPMGETTKATYNADDSLTSITDPRGLITRYSPDGFGNVTKTQSPDTKNTGNTYDSAGNMLSQTDAGGKKVTYGYDALNRLTQINYGAKPVTFTYDQGQNSIGRLAQMSDETGATQWSYNNQAGTNVVAKIQKIGTLTLVMRYSYDSAGRLQTMTYPSGKKLQFSYVKGQVSRIQLGSTDLLRQIQYQPFGDPASWQWGNGTLNSRSFDQDGRISQYSLGGNHKRKLKFDAAGRIVGYTDVNPTANQSFTYDALDRLLESSTAGKRQVYNYDANGNRLSVNPAAGGTIYHYATDSNRLLSSLRADAKKYTYDASGNITSNGVFQFGYDGRGRLVKAENKQAREVYKINGLGQRVAKISYKGNSITGSTVFVYDGSGHLIGEYDAKGRVIQETVYLGNIPVAVMTATGNYYIYADHLNTPRIIINNAGKIVWQWDSQPFGNSRATSIQGFTYNLRFPGQYLDSFTGLHYNGFRDYNPNTGRYMQSDPIGLMGGINTYAYGLNNPISFYDPSGYQSCSISDNNNMRNSFDDVRIWLEGGKEVYDFVTGGGIKGYVQGKLNEQIMNSLTGTTQIFPMSGMEVSPWDPMSWVWAGWDNFVNAMEKVSDTLNEASNNSYP